MSTADCLRIYLFYFLDIQAISLKMLCYFGISLSVSLFVPVKTALWAFLVDKQQLCLHLVLLTKTHCVSLRSNKSVKSSVKVSSVKFASL